MGKIYRYRVFGMACIGKVHASIVQNQGHQIVAIGDDVKGAVLAAQDERELGGARTFLDPALMEQEMAGAMYAVIIASHTKNHTRDALPFVKAKIPVYL